MKRHAIALALVALLAPALASAAGSADVVCVELSRNIGFGATDAAYGGEVSALQGFLGRVGALASEPTGYFGLLTRDAVIAFQESNDIQATGAVDQVTRDVIRRQSCARGEATAVSAGASQSTVKVGSVTFDLTPVPNRAGAKSSTGSASSAATGKLKVELRASAEKILDGEASVTAAVAPRSTNDQVEIWELSVDCNRGVDVFVGDVEVCGEVVSKYAYALEAPERGFTILRAVAVNSLTKRNSVNLTLSALDADGNVMAKATKRVRISAAPKDAN